jgi:hypothetical protein
MFERNPALAGNSRIGPIGELGDDVSWLEVATLAFIGLIAALTSAYVRFGLRIPGSSLAMAALPMAFGFALVPRQLAGTTMSGGALLTATLMDASGAHSFGVGALASLVSIGPLLDVTLARARGGWRLYLGFVLAGLAANLIAFMIRGGSKLFAFDAPGRRLLDDWLAQAPITYLLTGAFAGLLSAACWFRARRET